MKKILMILFAAVASMGAWAEDINGLKIEMKQGVEQSEVQMLFTAKPVLTHSVAEGAATITVSATDVEPVTIPVANIAQMVFLHIEDTPDGINLVENNTNKRSIIYDLNGRRVTTLQKGQVYIVNGKKVLVK